MNDILFLYSYYAKEKKPDEVLLSFTQLRSGGLVVVLLNSAESKVV